ncbi:hypothetical protein [Komarekiella delphini-convector]|nr:hypothetical protein [Komarekiella delphini-convector]
MTRSNYELRITNYELVIIWSTVNCQQPKKAFFITYREGMGFPDAFL